MYVLSTGEATETALVSNLTRYIPKDWQPLGVLLIADMDSIRVYAIYPFVFKTFLHPLLEEQKVLPKISSQSREQYIPLIIKKIKAIRRKYLISVYK